MKKTIVPVLFTFAACLAVPANADIVIGAPAVGDNCFPFGCSYGGEYQQVYDANAFSGPITITGLDFYNTNYNAGATAMNSATGPSRSLRRAPIPTPFR